MVDRCKECGKILDDDDDIGHYENRPYGDTVASEYIVTGYHCKNCGYEEEW